MTAPKTTPAQHAEAQRQALKIYDKGWQYVCNGSSTSVAISEIINGTIEDCAQLFEPWKGAWPPSPQEIAAAIRAKKDKP